LVVDLMCQVDQRRAERGGDLVGQHGLAGAGLALDQQRAAPA
jgi:hypothetical protein